jgi:putative transcriptional regulator
MIQHHPDPEILAEYAGGALHAGAMLVVACHLEGCAICRQETGLWESVGGALLEASPPAKLSEGARARMMAMLDDDPSQSPIPELPRYLERFDIPLALKTQRIGRRRFFMPGLWFAPVGEGDDGTARTYLVYAKPGTVLAEHTHPGREFTHVLAGAFADSDGIFAQGDFALTDGQASHSPAVTREQECLCLISSDAPMQLSGLPARLLQRLTGTLY